MTERGTGGLSIRPARTSEAPTLTRIALAAKAHWGYADARMALWRDELTITPDLIGTARVDCAVLDGRIVGFCAVEPDGDAAEIGHLWVDPAWIGQGIGSALFEHAVEVAAAAGARRLVAVSDPNAAGFYAKMGARRVGEQESTPPGRLLPVMELELAPGRGPRVSAVPEIRTARLLLRAWRREDRDAFAAINADPLVAESLGGPISRERSDATADRAETSLETNGLGFWAVEVPGVAPFVGMAGLCIPAFEAPFMPAVEAGWRLGSAYWGRGYASEAGRASLEFAFDVLGLEEVVAFTAAGNVRSRRVMERIGMSRDTAGDFDHPLLAVGSPLRRHVLYRVRRPG